ncbi:cytochrome P450 78A4-like [Cryptomeria japonica]|uniref:cytochrome P450 78A4-like n=1 Tax=Cryptomeria japonica TaxID=3369 RepID=UPI0027D9EE45|nr:cytochrome P450 78A4-like [Cryptomeria japonica]
MENRTASCGGAAGWWDVYALVPLPNLCFLDSIQVDKSDICAWKQNLSILVAALLCAVILSRRRTGGCSWAGKNKKKKIPGPRGWPIIGILMEMSGGHAHRKLAHLAAIHEAKKLMAFSLGSTRVVITSDPEVARELLSSPHFADRPLKQSAQQLMFGRAMGFAPNGNYWRMLRRISAAHLFSPRRIAAHEAGRQVDSVKMLSGIRNECACKGAVSLRPHLQAAALENIMRSLFGVRLDSDGEGREVREMVEEGFELLGAFNWADHVPWLRPLDPLQIHDRCTRLLPRVRSFVQHIINQHRQSALHRNTADSDFMDVLLSLEGQDKLHDEDIIAVLWEMIFRGTDTVALVTEWTMAEMVLNEEIQGRAQMELEAVIGRDRSVRDEDIARLPYLQAVVKESLRMHPPGPLLSWARLCTEEVDIAGDMHVSAGKTAMVNMWSITHDPEIWESPHEFRPERFVEDKVDVLGNDLRLAPFGSGRRVCPGKALGLATVHLWVAKLLHHYKWIPSPQHPVDLTEVLKLSSQMATPLAAIPTTINPY